MRSQVSRRRQQGQSVVEIAVVAPFLLVLVLTAMNVGIYVSDMLNAGTASRQAARLAAAGRRQARHAHPTDIGLRRADRPSRDLPAAGRHPELRRQPAAGRHPRPGTWYWQLRYNTTASVQAVDTITVTVTLRGAPAHLLSS
jgi:hypothetical protein